MNEFLELLYGGAVAKGHVEIRYLKSGSRDWMAWPTFPEAPDRWTPAKIPAGQEAYWGVSLRRDQTDGKKANCLPTRLVWTDVDLVDHPSITGGQSKDGLLEASPDELAEMKAALQERIQLLAEERELPIRAIVDSGHGLQVYWARRAASDLADTERYNKALRLLLDGDDRATDASRVLRIPGTENLKNAARPLPVRLVFQDPDAWVDDAALDALPLPAKAAPAPAAPAAPRNLMQHDRQTRYALSGFYAEVDQLAATAEGGRNDQLNKAAFSAGTLVGAGLIEEAQAVAELTDAARRAGLTDDEIAPTLASGLDAGKREPRDMNRVNWHEAPERPRGTISGRTALAYQEQVEEAPQTSPDEMPATGIYVAYGGYWIDRPKLKNGEVVGYKPEQLTNWVWEPELRLEYPDGTYGERGTLLVRGRGHQIPQLHSRSWNGRRELLEAIGGYQARCMTTNNADIAKIGEYVAASYPDLPVATGVKSYGLHRHEGEWVEVFEDTTISSHDTPPLFYSGTPVDPGSRSYRAPKSGSEDDLDEARQAIIKLPSLITPAVAYALLGYGAASAFSPRITPHLGNRLPFVYVAGERESGKTSGAQIVLELMTGQQARLTKASGMTAYQYDIAHSSANNLLALLDEYRPGEIDDGQLRKHHDLGTKWRGSGVASKDLAYELNAPLVVLGEGFTDDAATKSRGVLYLTRKADRGGLEVYSDLLKLKLSSYAGHLHRLARETPEPEHLTRLAQAGELANQAIDGSANPRLRYALQYVAYGLLVLQEDTGAIPDSAILDTLKEGVFNTLEGGQEGVTNLELFLEQLCSALGRISSATNMEAYVIPGAEKGTLILRPRMCVDLVKERFKEQAAISNAKLFNQYAEQAEWFIGSESHRDHNQERTRGRKVKLEGIPERCDASLLATIEKRMRGGTE